MGRLRLALSASPQGLVDLPRARGLAGSPTTCCRPAQRALARAIYALGTVGLTLVYGIAEADQLRARRLHRLRRVHGLSGQRHLGAPLVVGVFWAMAATALLGLLFRRTLWGPMRRRLAGFLQLILMSLGLAFVLRAVFTWFWGTEIRLLDVDTTSTVELLGLVGQDELIVLVVGVVVLVATGLMLRYALLGKRMRALSDDLDLAETAGIDTRRVILYTWIFSGALAGLAGVLAGRDDQPPTRARLRATAPDLRSRHPGRHR